jgi:hypothetical protein
MKGIETLSFSELLIAKVIPPSSLLLCEMKGIETSVRRWRVFFLGGGNS